MATMLLPTPATALADPAGIAATAMYTDGQVRAEWLRLRPDYSGAAYTTSPSTSSPYAPGVVKADFLADGLGVINFARFLAGLPNDVVLDPTRTGDAQYGATLLAVSAQLTHEPPRPADMTWAFYDRAVASTMQSNIGYGHPESEGFQLSCLADADSGNITRLGHRRWLLNPPLLKTGIGFVSSRHTTYIFDRSRTQTVDYTVIAYPSAGPFPVDQGFFSSATPWSITLNPARYDWDPSGHTVTLRRIADGRTWTFNSADTNAAGEYFKADFGGYGVGNAFIFRPAPTSVTYRAGDEFDVTLSGGIYLNNTRTPTTVSYRTRFMSLAESPVPSTLDIFERLSGSCRYGTAVSVARAAFPGWDGVRHVILAAGDDRAASDPLAASGLCWAYDAPMLLVPSGRQPSEAITALREIVAVNGPVTLHVVGGTGALPDARIAEIAAAVGPASVSVDRIIDYGNRYDLARAIANRMRQVAAQTPGKAMPDAVLIANGESPSSFYDALALSPISAATGAPILLVQANAVPDATLAAFEDLNRPSVRIIAGGSAVVSEAVRSQLQATRWAGATRYETAAAVANGAVARGWLTASSVSVAATLPDALTGGSLAGAQGGVLVLSGSTGLPASTRSWLDSNAASIESCYLLGGTGALSEAVAVQVGGTLP